MNACYSRFQRALMNSIGESRQGSGCEAGAPPQARQQHPGTLGLSGLVVPVLLVAVLVGCATPSHVASLNAILTREERPSRAGRAYRCTVGAHRGASVEFRENTMAALRAADRSPAYAFIEFDVQYSKDQRIVVYHDQRMLRLFGSARAIGNTAFNDLSRISAGEILAYDQVIGHLTKPLNIEIKSQGDRKEDERLVDEIMADLTARRRHRDVLISSISADVIAYMTAKYPKVPTGQVFWLRSSTYLHLDALTRRLYDEVRATGADYLLLHEANLRNIDDLLRLKPRGKTIVFWDFDDTIYIVHKDLSDRLWGDSAVTTAWKALRYRLASWFVPALQPER